MKKIMILVGIILSTICLTGCDKQKITKLEDNIRKINFTGNLVTYKAYYHNVIEYEKKAGTGFIHLFEKDRKLFAEYSGTVNLGINLSQVKIEVNNNKINVKIPKATVIGEPDVDRDDFKKENFIESKDGINSNEINGDDISQAFNLAQQSMKENAANDQELLSVAQKRAKVLIEENIRQFSGLADNKYDINWEYEQ